MSYQYEEPLYDKDPSILNSIFQPSNNRKCVEKNPDITNPHYNEPIIFFPVPWHFAIQYDTIQCNAIQYNTVQYSTIKYNKIQ